MTEKPKLAVVVPLRPADPPRTMDEATLVELVRARDVDGIRELHRRYAAVAERILVRMVGFVPERADLLHDVLIRAIEGIGELRSPGALRSWVCGIAVRRAYEHRRARKRIPAELKAEPEATTGDPVVALEVRRVYALLEQLDEDDRAAFVLRRIDGMELTETAAVCGVSLATIKRRISRAEDRFRTLAAADPLLRGRLERRTT